MKTGRADWDAFVKVGSIPADEPVFLLRAQNSWAAETVRDWAANGLSKGMPAAVAEQALRQADAMDAWPVKKPVTADHLSDAERKQLAYAHARRVWNVGRMSQEALVAALMLDLLANIAAAPEDPALISLKAQAEAISEAIRVGREHA
jgi:hypothetical protein